MAEPRAGQRVGGEGIEPSTSPVWHVQRAEECSTPELPACKTSAARLALARFRCQTASVGSDVGSAIAMTSVPFQRMLG